MIYEVMKYERRFRDIKSGNYKVMLKFEIRGIYRPMVQGAPEDF